ncbi:MAG: transcriptional antiterminator, Rof [Gammaproteobacteria bacterium]|nr:transcriptional antiterminator, Rof [Gammaproteobacteria bacterium]MBU2478517.1 transcriptional antiterminator, Rof [Gammaproteobacteria bacterium]
MMSDYTPIDCDRYSEYELAIMRKWKLRIAWQDVAGLSHIETLLPEDLQTRLGEEFLIATTTHGERMEIRLDQISEAKRLSDDRP